MLDIGKHGADLVRMNAEVRSRQTGPSYSTVPGERGGFSQVQTGEGSFVAEVINRLTGAVLGAATLGLGDGGTEQAAVDRAVADALAAFGDSGGG